MAIYSLLGVVAPYFLPCVEHSNLERGRKVMSVKRICHGQGCRTKFLWAQTHRQCECLGTLS